MKASLSTDKIIRDCFKDSKEEKSKLSRMAIKLVFTKQEVIDAIELDIKG